MSIIKYAFLLIILGETVIAAPGDDYFWSNPVIQFTTPGVFLKDNSRHAQVHLILNLYNTIFSDKQVDDNFNAKYFTKSSNGLYLGGAVGELLYYQLGYIDKNLVPQKKLTNVFPLLELLRLRKKEIAASLGIKKDRASDFITFLVANRRSDVTITPNSYLFSDFPEKYSQYVTIIIFPPPSDSWTPPQKVKTVILRLVMQKDQYKISFRGSFINNQPLLNIIGIHKDTNDNYRLQKDLLIKLKNRLESGNNYKQSVPQKNKMPKI